MERRLIAAVYISLATAAISVFICLVIVLRVSPMVAELTETIQKLIEVLKNL